eukprot:CAMPEP_0119424388 /NCGR_PEP_ID=MMETSP1335-20130426/32427_1 /TAXON_ID=259385 /ORGANISM="Chrysoculter rhomboideus, Strain RCC1486" /LENGTH=463 /DNA_ID=CAMNT_0007449909 /DNA_START=16 /DNA_END=1407 /DNA_ORIENTATION=-
MATRWTLMLLAGVQYVQGFAMAQAKTASSAVVNAGYHRRVPNRFVASTLTTPVHVYSTMGCPYCVRAKKTLSQLGVPYIEHDVTDDEVMRADVAQRSMRTSVPQIFIADTHLGGCDDLLRAVENGQLAAMLKPYGLTLGDKQARAESELSPSERAVPPELLPHNGILNHLSGGAHSTTDRAAHKVDANEISASLQRQILGLYDEFVMADGSSVDYARMRRSSRFFEYARAASELRMLPLFMLQQQSHEAQLSFWLNLYNAMVVHGMAVVGAPAGPEERRAFYGGQSGVTYDIGGKRFSLDDIEHGIVRGSPAHDARAFSRTDTRYALVLPRERFDARIHFALNCGAKSCPPIKIYEAEQLDFALGLAAQAFCESTTTVDRDARTVRVSKLFEWYAVDFGQDARTILARIDQYLSASTSAVSDALRALLTSESAGDDLVQVEYDAYDWGVNDVAKPSPTDDQST